MSRRTSTGRHRTGKGKVKRREHISHCERCGVADPCRCGAREDHVGEICAECRAT